MVWRSLHHKEMLLSEPGRNRRECILTRNSPFPLRTWPTRRQSMRAPHEAQFNMTLTFDPQVFLHSINVQNTKSLDCKLFKQSCQNQQWIENEMSLCLWPLAPEIYMCVPFFVLRLFMKYEVEISMLKNFLSYNVTIKCWRNMSLWLIDTKIGVIYRLKT